MVGRVWSFSKSLASIFRALPKNGRGAASAASARYAIHRALLERHGWQVKGSDPLAALGTGLGAGLAAPARDAFEERLGARGFDMHELAVLGASLENLIHSEVVVRLEATYSTLNKSLDRNLDKNSALGIIDTFMAAYVSGRDMFEMSHEQAAAVLNETGHAYPGWERVRGFVRATYRDISGKRITMGFRDVTTVVEAINEGFGRNLVSECDIMRDRLLQLEEVGGTGRIKLSDFHASGTRYGYWEFRETADYLRHVGAMDDSNPSEPKVIIPNYFHAPSNCHASSKYYSVCCSDPCERILAQLEGELQAPHASVEAIVYTVSKLMKASASPYRVVSAVLVGKLKEVADQNGGLVPLHGRLFAQWLHFVYPRDCTYPHISNSTMYSDAQEYRRQTGKAHDHTTTELTGFSSRFLEVVEPAVAPAEGDEPGMCMSMWEPVEELVDPVHGVPKPDNRKEASLLRLCFRVLAMMALLVSMCLIMKESVVEALKLATADIKSLAWAGVSLGLP